MVKVGDTVVRSTPEYLLVTVRVSSVRAVIAILTITTRIGFKNFLYNKKGYL